MSEEEILADLTSYKLEFTKESGLEMVENLLEELNPIKDTTEHIQSGLYWKRTIDLSMIAFDLMLDGVDQVFTTILRNKRFTWLVHLFNSLMTEYNNFDFEKTKPAAPYLCSYDRMTHNEYKLSTFVHLNRLINGLIARSEEATVYAIYKGLVEQLLNLVDNHAFIDKMESYYCGSLGIFVLNINCLASIQHKNRWHNADAFRILTKVLITYPKYSLTLYKTLVAIAFDSDLEKLIEMSEMIDRIVEMVLRGVRGGKQLLNSFEIIDEIDQTNHKFENMSIVDKQENSISSVSSYVITLYGIAINEKCKKILHAKPRLTESVKSFFYTGNEYEQSCCLEYIAQLCFEDEINKEISQDSEFVTKIKEISTLPSRIKFKTLLKSSKQLLWLLERDQQARLDLGVQESDKYTSESPRHVPHIMISYNRESRDLCVIIKEKLEELGMRVWMDVSDMRGSTLEAMAQAVERAECVLMCVTEKYRQSINCQAEARYAFKMQKKIVPLIMQEGYGNVGGWLGFIMSDKMFVDFTKYSYDECIDRLLKEISFDQTSATSQVPVKNTKVENKNVANVSTPKSWNESQVENWFTEMELKSVYDGLKPLDGQILYQLFEFKTYTPEFFYKSIAKHESIDMKQAARFSLCLVKLFQGENNK